MKTITTSIDSVPEPALIKRARGEIAILKQLKNTFPLSRMFPHIHKVIETQNSFIIFMEYIQGLTLELIQTTPNKIKFIFDECLKIIKELHNVNILHRDIKPDNIKFDTENNRIVFVDFGLSCTMHDRVVTRSKFATSLQQSDVIVNDFGVICDGTAGTVGFIDQSVMFSKTKYNDSRSDVYSFGMTMYGLIMKKPPIITDTYEKSLYVYEIYKEELIQQTRISETIIKSVIDMIHPNFKQRPYSFQIPSTDDTLYSDFGDALYSDLGVFTVDEIPTKLDKTKIKRSSKTNSSTRSSRTNTSTNSKTNSSRSSSSTGHKKQKSTSVNASQKLDDGNLSPILFFNFSIVKQLSET